MAIYATVTGIKEQHKNYFDWPLPPFPFKVIVIQVPAYRSAFDTETLVIPVGLSITQNFWPGWFEFEKKTLK